MLNCTGAIPCCSVTDDNAFGTVTFSNGEFAALTNSTTPTSVVVVPLVGVIDVIEMLPLHVPWLSAFPGLAMLTVINVGVAKFGTVACNQPTGQVFGPVFPWLMLNENGSPMPELRIWVVCAAGNACPSS